MKKSLIRKISIIALIILTISSPAIASQKDGNKQQEQQKTTRQIKEKLQKQYPISWFYKKYGFEKAEGYCVGGYYNETDEILKYCILSSEKKEKNYSIIVNNFTTDQIKSILVNYDYSGRMYFFIKNVLSEIGKNPKNKKLNEIKNFIISKDYLMITNFGCDVFRYVPESLPYYEEMVSKQIGRTNGRILSCLSNKFKDDEEFVVRAISGVDAVIASSDNEGDGIYPIDHSNVFDSPAPCHYSYSNLQYASERLKDNESVVWFAITRKASFALRYASTRLQEKFRDIRLPENKNKFEEYQNLYGKNYSKYQNCEQ